ncbi:MAG TPA: hypothetical protein VGV35_05275 [Bryobacteraceae bacterium]|nr:hypothetical protein [Bryobacteraceae bacterium]
MTPRRQSPESKRRLALTLWIVLLISLGMYFAVIRMIRPEEPADNPALVRILLVIAAGLAAASFAVKNWFQSRARSENKPALHRAGYLSALVFCEAAAFCGVVVWFVTASPQYYWFLLIGIVAMLLHYPSRTE